MVANIRCAEIMEEQLAAFRGDPAWAALAEEAGQDLAAGFGQRAADLMDSCLEGECCAALCLLCCAVPAVVWWMLVAAGGRPDTHLPGGL
jgi:hypothetical protein